MTLTEIEKCTILRCQVGSVSLGLNLDTGDRDEMGICIEPIEHRVTMGEGFEQYIHRDAAVRTGDHDAPSMPGDLDLTVYSLRKFCRLACGGNPNLINLLFTPVKYQISAYSVGHQLQEMSSLFISREAASHYLGYMQAQRARMLGLQGQKRIKRPELEEKYGYDTKYAMHMLRLGVQGVELLTTGSLSLPMLSKDREYLLGVRQGLVPLQEVNTYAGELERQLKDLKESCPLRDHPERLEIDQWMRQRYWHAWRATEIPACYGIVNQ